MGHPQQNSYQVEAITVQVLDEVHLEKQTLGNHQLKREVLQLFLVQIEMLMERIEQVTTDETRLAAAHTIKGSARNIGAWAVAEQAAFLEKADKNNLSSVTNDLRCATNVVCRQIREMLVD